MDTSTLVIAFLLVTAASLASYLLSQWSSIRDSNLGLGWVVISIGVTLLLAAAAIVVLAVGLLPEPWLSPDIESAESKRQSTQSSDGMAVRLLDAQESNATTKAAAPADRGVSPAANRYVAEGRSERRSGIEPAPAASSRPSPGAPRQTSTPHNVGLVFTEEDPWAATNCVFAINRDPEDLTRWTIENECGSPVALVFASCSKSPSECSGRLAAWEYQVDGMILPGKAQRPVTYEEETRYGKQIRYVACVVADWRTIRLIGQNSETRSSASWLERFEAARNDDACLTQVQTWSDMGRRSGSPIDVLLGPNVPGKVRPDSASEP